MQANQSQNTSNEAIFGFMSQAPIVQALLNASVAALPRLPQPERDVLANALRRFETFGVPMLWSPNDVMDVDDVELTHLEKRDAFFYAAMPRIPRHDGTNRGPSRVATRGGNC